VQFLFQKIQKTRPGFEGKPKTDIRDSHPSLPQFKRLTDKTIRPRQLSWPFYFLDKKSNTRYIIGSS